MNSFDFGIDNMSRCVAEIRQAQEAGERDKNMYNTILVFHARYDVRVGGAGFDALILALTNAQSYLPSVYQTNISEPLIKFLKNYGNDNFNNTVKLMPDLVGAMRSGKGIPNDGLPMFQQRVRLAGIIPEVSYAVLSGRDHDLTSSLDRSTIAFEELVSDLYEGFLSAESRNKDGLKINPPELGVVPPLVKWGSPEDGPYTVTVDSVKGIGVNVSVVSLPNEYARKGVPAWSALSHETAGHDILHAYPSLLGELSSKVSRAVFAETNNQDLANYWGSRLDETASDVLGILNMGPAAGIGVITFFRGIFSDGRLRSIGFLSDPHPVDILRGYLAGYVVKQLTFREKDRWANRIIRETDRDLAQGDITIIGLDGTPVLRLSQDEGKRSAEIVAETIANTALVTLQKHSFRQIQDWSDDDDYLATIIALGLQQGLPLPEKVHGAGFYAAHVVAGATYEVLRDGSDPAKIFTRMIDYLVEMNRGNPTWMTGINRRIMIVKHNLPIIQVAGAVTAFIAQTPIQSGFQFSRFQRFTPPGNVDDDLTGVQLGDWSRQIEEYLNVAKAGYPEQNDGPRHRFFVRTKKDIAVDAVIQSITWVAFPRLVASLNPGEYRFYVADSSRDFQDEFCEWSVKRNDVGKITSVTFTCEGPEYWEFLARNNPHEVLTLYRQHISDKVQEGDLFPQRGPYNPRNKWNKSTTDGAMHLIHQNNSLVAEIDLVAGASTVRIKENNRHLTDPDELIKCSGYGEPGRNSDPKVGAEVNALARRGMKVTLLNPVGLYFDKFDPQGWITPDHTDPTEFWKWTRGTKDAYVRAEFKVPREKSYTVGDIMINGRPIKYGSQITDFIHMKMKVVGVAQTDGLVFVRGCKGDVLRIRGSGKAGMVGASGIHSLSSRASKSSPVALSRSHVSSFSGSATSSSSSTR